MDAQVLLVSKKPDKGMGDAAYPELDGRAVLD